jgi:hypothetical protein
MDLQAHLKGLKKASKSDPVPGTFMAMLDENCPECNTQLRLLKPCCLHSGGTKECGGCGWREYIDK